MEINLLQQSRFVHSISTHQKASRHKTFLAARSSCVVLSAFLHQKVLVWRRRLIKRLFSLCQYHQHHPRCFFFRFITKVFKAVFSHDIYLSLYKFLIKKNILKGYTLLVMDNLHAKHRKKTLRAMKSPARSSTSPLTPLKPTLGRCCMFTCPS